jgi:hypothetical protein
MKKNTKFILPIFLFEKQKQYSCNILAKIKIIKNKNHDKYGKVGIYTDSMYSKLEDHFKYKQYMEYDEAVELLTELNFIEVWDDFDVYEEEHWKIIESKLPEGWFTDWKLRYTN